MLNVMLCVALVLLVITAYKAVQKHKEAKYYADQWKKWEREYWLLRSSEAINDGFSIHLSWLPLGEDNCIVRDA